MLATFQQGCAFESEKVAPPFQEHVNTEDKWYCISPVISHNTKTSPKVKDTSARVAMDDKTREKLERELLFVNKPSHLHCVPSRSLSDSLATQVLSLHPGSKPCHRLDRDTSGIVLFGLTKEAHRDISMQFEARTTSKTYVALIAGRPEKDHGTVNLPIGKQMTKEGYNRWTIGGEKPRESITHWAIDNVFTDEETGAVFTRVALSPVTGRGHQLRLHMKAIGCPILGDTIHGEGAIAQCSSRLCLHAQSLRVDWNGLRLKAESVPPF
jgi:tRNA pseudouridine32 synthase/23S rRNA pseudouridine746 synthase